MIQFWLDVLAQAMGDLAAGVLLVWLAVRWEHRLDTVEAKRQRREQKRDG